MNITVKKASGEDAAAMLEYLKQIGGETENLTFGAEGLLLTPEDEADFIAHAANSRDEVMLVAKNGDRIVGDASLTRLPRRMKHRGDLGIAVIKEYWNKGVGSMLLSSVIEFARENRFKIIDLQVRSDNAAAIHLYEKFGFERIGTHPSFFNIDGDDVPFDYMYLRLK